jgi:hypothetical protein
MAKSNIDKNISIWALIISVISIGISVAFGIRSCSFENKINKLHVDPILSYYLVRSIDKKGLEFVLKNESPIPVVNLSVTFKAFDFDLKLNKYIVERPASSSIFDSPGENWIFKSKVNPHETIGRIDTFIVKMLDLNKEKIDLIEAMIFDITFYRESDMKLFQNKAIFFFDGEKIYSYKNALIEGNLNQPVEQLSKFEQEMKNFRNWAEKQTGGDRFYQKAE